MHYWKLALSLALVNLAVTASVSGLVCLIGSAGAAVGGILYFLLGLPISGAATALPLLPAFWRDFGQALPPGAAATLLRRVLYFPDAPIGGPLLVLGLYAGIGVLVVGVVNLLAGAHHRNSLADLPERAALTGQQSPAHSPSSASAVSPARTGKEIADPPVMTVITSM